MERSAFLQRVEGALGGREAPPLPASWPAHPGSGTTDGSDPERFVVELAKTAGIARIVASDQLADEVGRVVRELGPARRVLVTADVHEFGDAVDEGVAVAGGETVRPSPASWREEAAGADLAITSAVLGIAATGSVLLAFGPGQPRASSLLPPAHLVILPTKRLVPGLEEAMPVLASLAQTSSSGVLVTGPSRTSDIEMVTVYGVHGPKAFRVLLVK